MEQTKKKKGFHFTVNPIVKKDLRILSRSSKYSWGLFAYELILGLVFFFAMLVIEDNSAYGYLDQYQDFVALFPAICYTQMGIIALLLPIITASSIAGEKERQTFDIMLTTVMSPRQIITGKVFSAVIRVMMFIIASVPLMALSFTLGGLSWWSLLAVIIGFFVFAIYSGSVGILASTLTRKSLVSIILAFVIYAAIGMLTVVPLLFMVFISYLSIDEVIIEILIMLNPFYGLGMLIYLLSSGEMLGGLFGGNNNIVLSLGGVLISGAVTLVLSFVLQGIAARRIDPLKGYRLDKRKIKKMKGVTPLQPVPAGVQPMQPAGPQWQQPPVMQEVQPIVESAQPAQTIMPEMPPMQITQPLENVQPVVNETQAVMQEVQPAVAEAADAQPAIPEIQPVMPEIQQDIPVAEPVVSDIQQTIMPEVQPVPEIRPVPEVQPVPEISKPISQQPSWMGTARNE